MRLGPKNVLLSHETSGGMLPYAAMRLRRLARAAAALGNDPTDYSISYTASGYVSYYSQRLSSACVLNGARGVLKGVAKMRATRRAAATAASGVRVRPRECPPPAPPCAL